MSLFILALFLVFRLFCDVDTLASFRLSPPNLLIIFLWIHLRVLRRYFQYLFRVICFLRYQTQSCRRYVKSTARDPWLLYKGCVKPNEINCCRNYRFPIRVEEMCSGINGTDLCIILAGVTTTLCNVVHYQRLPY